ncbi:calmodulin-like [Mizuhopecten yessoensis]|uniref:calmodulin-like n=1 Tax=Mizuhopecten yessoensis TaxID=6573 RepID=UPI000B459EE9|nr:calmodulin-like [Mizuhopecten yessoensis]
MLTQYVLNAEAKWKVVFEDIMRCREPQSQSGGPAGFTLEEFRKYIREFLRKKDVSDVEIKDMFFDLDVDGKNFVNQVVFVKEMSRAPRRQAYEAAFDMKDFNRDGKLGQDEITNAFQIVGVKDELVKKFFKEVDINKDGYISKTEFMKMV